MLILGIHCAGAYCDVALLEGETVLARESEPMKRGHDQKLPILTKNVSSSAGISLAEVKCFAVCVGPGSFTGTRVGVAFARGLALANGSTAVGVTSLEAMSLAANSAPALAILPAKQRLPDISFWTQGFDGPHLPDPAEISAEDLSNFAAGTQIGLAPEALLSDAESYVPDLDWRAGISDAETVARYAARHQGKLRPASPVYVREPDAVPAKPLV